jgi:hypothetical protein
VPLGSGERALALTAIGADTDLADESFAVVEDCRAMGPLVGVDADDEHEDTSRDAVDDTPAGKPEEGRVLAPVSSHAETEHQRAACSLGSQPARVAGHSGDHPPALETLRANPSRHPTSSFRALWAGR